jgi:hypothetical protein
MLYWLTLADILHMSDQASFVFTPKKDCTSLSLISALFPVVYVHQKEERWINDGNHPFKYLYPSGFSMMRVFDQIIHRQSFVDNFGSVGIESAADFHQRPKIEDDLKLKAGTDKFQSNSRLSTNITLNDSIEVKKDTENE